MVKHDVDLAPYTSIRIGGCADELHEVHDRAELGAALARAEERGVDAVLLGGGANVLIHDERRYAVVIKLERDFGAIREEPDRVVAEAGVYLSRLVREGVRAGWGGFERLAGIPGTLGGAIAMNAGIPAFEIFDLVEEVQGLDRDGREARLTPTELRPRYRHGNLPAGFVVTEVVLARRAGDPVAMAAAARELKAQRRAKQPLQHPSFGSTFTNPGARPGAGADGWGASAAGALIERAGLKGLRRGDAQLSEMHANFVVNLGRATARDVLDLMIAARRAVAERFGVWLEPEVRMIGFTAEELRPLREREAA